MVAESRHGAHACNPSTQKTEVEGLHTHLKLVWATQNVRILIISVYRHANYAQRKEDDLSIPLEVTWILCSDCECVLRGSPLRLAVIFFWFLLLANELNIIFYLYSFMST